MSSRKVNSDYARIYARKIANMYTKKLHRKGSNQIDQIVCYKALKNYSRKYTIKVVNK